MFTKKSVASFYECSKAYGFIAKRPKQNLIVIKELDGMFHVYDMDGE